MYIFKLKIVVFARLHNIINDFRGDTEFLQIKISLKQSCNYFCYTSTFHKVKSSLLQHAINLIVTNKLTGND